MRLYTIKAGGREKVAVLKDDGLFHVLAYADMNELLKDQDRKYQETGETFKQDDVQILAPVPRPLQDLVCVGVNYSAHRKEFEKQEKVSAAKDTIYFAKRVNEAVAPGGEIDAHEGYVSFLDYEAELGVIIGKDALNVAYEDALDYVFGYTIINDVTARDVQKRHSQWYLGKSLDHFTPMGPCIVTADEIGDVHALAISCHVNGQLRQDSNTSLMIANVNKIISELTQGMTLKAGTIIATGTPSGVGMGMEPPISLKKGDEVVCEIEKIGKLVNTVN